MTDELVHYGVKGMKWGVRRDHSLATGYSKGQFNYDAQQYGKGHARRVNQRVKKGVDLHEARRAEIKRRNRTSTAFGAAVAGYLLYRNSESLQFAGKVVKAFGRLSAGTANVKVNQRANRKREEAGRREAREMLADERGLTNYSSIRLEFNPRTGEWG